jgi:hypothetical protein
VTCTNANQVYQLGQILAAVGGSDLQNGTNLLQAVEFIVTDNQVVGPATGTGASPTVWLFRTNATNGTATNALNAADNTTDSQNIKETLSMDEPAVVGLATMDNMDSRKFAVACSVSGHTLNVKLRVWWQTPVAAPS